MSRGSIIAAVLVGYCGFVGLSSRIEAARRSSGSLDVDHLTDVDWSLPGWTSNDVDTGDDLRRLIGADAILRKRYVRGATTMEVTVTSYHHAAAGLKHSADVCLTTSGWLITQRRTAEASRDPMLSIALMGVRRASQPHVGSVVDAATVASTFLLGDGSYATQPEAKFAFAKEAGLFGSCTLTYVEVAAWTSGGGKVDETTLADVVATIASRVRPRQLHRDK